MLTQNRRYPASNPGPEQNLPYSKQSEQADIVLGSASHKCNGRLNTKANLDFINKFGSTSTKQRMSNRHENDQNTWQQTRNVVAETCN